MRERLGGSEWVSILRPGYLGKNREGVYRDWNKNYGKGNWRIVNETANGTIFSYEDIIYKVYVPGYEAYFLKNTDEALYITENYSFGYDKDPISVSQAFDIYALYGKSGTVNQFHHVAFNIALKFNLGLIFRGGKPLQVRERKPGTPDSDQPNGFRWSPGRIPCTLPELIPALHIAGWWSYNSIEDFYQSTKVLQIK